MTPSTEPHRRSLLRSWLLPVSLAVAAALGVIIAALRRRESPPAETIIMPPEDRQTPEMPALTPVAAPSSPVPLVEMVPPPSVPALEPKPAVRAAPLLAVGILAFALLAAWVLGTAGEANSSPLPGLALAAASVGLAGLFANRYLAFTPLAFAASAAQPMPRQPMTRLISRVLLLGSAVFFSYQAAQIAEGQFVDYEVRAWAVSIALWFAVLSDWTALPNVPGLLQRVRAWAARRAFARGFRLSWSVLALAVILLVAVWFRFNDPAGYPTDMNWDLSHKAVDVQAVVQGWRPVFFDANSGREPFQFYFLAWLHETTGIPISLSLLTLATGLEGLVMIGLAWWMGRTLLGDEDRRLGSVTGLIMAGLVATSFWHTMLSRNGLRIVLTTLMSTLVFVLLVRALRSNRRRDFLLTGLALGASVYTYQATRIFPLLVVAGVGLTLALYPAARRQWQRYLVNTAALVILSVAIFVPLGMYMLRYPDIFWQRAAQNVTGDVSFDTSQILNNLSNLPSTAAQGLLMLNYQGDSSPFYGTPNRRPELDPVVSALFLVGLGLVAARALRRRDPLDPLLLVGVLVLLLPTILSLSDVPTEVPSASRASGALPLVYLIAALALAVIVMQVVRLRAAGLRLFVLAGIALLLVSSAVTDAQTIGVLSEVQKPLRFPFRQAGQIVREFVDSTGAPGNVFLVYSPMWIDARLVWMEAGLDPDLSNDIANTDPLGGVVVRIQQHHDWGKTEFAADRQILFLVSRRDEVSPPLLDGVFPGGSWEPVSTYNPDEDFLLYVAPAPGCGWVSAQSGVQDTPGCAAEPP